MKGFVKDIEVAATGNAHFRQVLYTAPNCQLVLMSLKPGEDIGMETHALDQFFRVEEGSGDAILDDVRSPIQPGFAVLVPAETRHNIINTGTIALKLTTLYAPPNHRDGTVHATRADGEKHDQRYDGKPTERRIPVTGTDLRENIPVSLRPRLSLRFSSTSTARS